MITKTFKTSAGNLKITIPSDLKEITVGMRLLLDPDPGDTLSPLQQISALSGVPIDSNSDDVPGLSDIYNIDELTQFDDTIQKLSYQLRAFVDDAELPEFINLPIAKKNKERWFGDRNVQVTVYKTVAVTKNLGIQPAGAYMEAKKVIADDMGGWIRQNLDTDIDAYVPLMSAQVKVLALYLYQPATGNKFTIRAAEAFTSVIKQMMVTEALPIARYFFLRYPNLAKETVKPSLQSLLKAKRLQRLID